VLATVEAASRIQRECARAFPPRPPRARDIPCRSYRSMGDHTETTEIDYDPSVISYDQVPVAGGLAVYMIIRNGE
jgi:hypothetical protein